MSKSTSQSNDLVSTYISQFPQEVQQALRQVRQAIRDAAPEAIEAISYKMPAFKMNGVLVYFAAWKKHIGLYPPVTGDKAIEKAVAPYAGKKGNLQFPLNEPMPIGLIRRIVALRVKQDTAKAAAKLASAKLKRKLSATVANGGAEVNDPEAVTRALQSLEHPLKPVIEGMRTTILKADRRISEGIKWNAPSFYCDGWFATFHLRAKMGIVLVLHHGAKVRSDAKLRQTIKDPKKLLQWASVDRASITFTSLADFLQKKAALKSIVQQWVETQVVLAQRTSR